MIGDVELRCLITTDLSLLRKRVQDFAMAAGLTGERLDDLVLAVNEAADNVVEHGAGAGTLIARADRQGVWVDIIDTAGTLTDGHLYRHGDDMPPEAMRGYGLWLVRRLCDQVLLDHPDGQTRLRLHMRFDHAAPPASARPQPAPWPRDVSGGRRATGDAIVGTAAYPA
ncbi:ATP-binding protein [Nonomuraea indica]|uniref:ATP-binding protein n=1 Tax=Nonomuraea indica TaxID=1581193 RepID=A0ABW8A8R6_9ACTN